uniref:Reverse transcriptase domain-containing protein n=1 Tax=Sparus aurata TaxID=8175 RepID=A0A671TKH7_SPAAU
MMRCGNYVGMLLLDLRKAFNTVNHDILTSKLQCMGFSNLALKWFLSYLTDRTQVCDVEVTLSEPQSIVCGVPQGSILGPLLFLLYINDMSAVVHCKLLLYADDSALLVPGCNVRDIKNTLGAELESVNQWLIDNKLSMHLGKTEPILFGTKRKLAKSNVLKVIYLSLA